MANYLKIIIAGIVGGLIVLFAGSLFGGDTFGAGDSTTITNPWTYQDTVQIGSNGSSITELKATACNLLGTDGSQTATTTAAYDCVVTGVATGDVVLAQLATTTNFLGGTLGWNIVAAKASTTAGYITVLLANQSGTARVPSATNVGSSTNVWYMDN